MNKLAMIKHNKATANHLLAGDKMPVGPFRSDVKLPRKLIREFPFGLLRLDGRFTFIDSFAANPHQNLFC
tara:strand:+ start:306 stop:515 length:210 start_codon:yes stop_codon:yes gene_type:complete